MVVTTHALLIYLTLDSGDQHCTDLLLHLVVQRNKPNAQCITSHIKS